MQQDFYKGRLKRNFGIDVITPDAQDQDLVHQVIFDELCMGMIRDKSREQFRKIISKLVKAGAGGIILGCTEIELLVKEQDSEVPLFPTTRIHALAAVEFALS
jgi:aspartate racemase